jgi:leucyl-tRNA synthetase
MDTFMDSSWYFLRFCDPQNSEQPFDIDKFKKWLPVDIYVGGMEHAIMHLLYARFIHKALCDINGINEPEKREPFKELIVQGLVKGKTFKDGSGRYFSSEQPGCTVTYEKMSKSKGNGVLPEDISKVYGVDALRSAILFGAPPESDLNFD